MHLRCKHIGALLLSLIALKDHSTVTVAPNDMKRPNMSRYEGMTDSVTNAVEANLTWTSILSNLLLDPPTKSGNYETSRRLDKFQVQPQQKKKSKSGHPATLESMTIVKLKELLKDMSLPVAGTKEVLIERIVSNRPIPPSVKNNDNNNNNNNNNKNIYKLTSKNVMSTRNAKYYSNSSLNSKSGLGISKLKSTSTKNQSQSKSSQSHTQPNPRKRKNEDNDKISSNKKLRKEITLLNVDTTRYLSKSVVTKRRDVKPNSKYIFHA